MTRSEALTFFDANKITLSGISGGQYIDKADFEKFAESLPETQPQEDEGKEAYWKSRCLAAELVIKVMNTPVNNAAGINNYQYEQFSERYNAWTKLIDQSPQ